MVPALAAGPLGLCFVCYRLQLPSCRAKVSFDASHYLHCFHCKQRLYHDAALHCSDSNVELYDVDQQQSPHELYLFLCERWSAESANVWSFA